jgi:sporulation integral membrane protein YlbJ
VKNFAPHVKGFDGYMKTRASLVLSLALTLLALTGLLIFPAAAAQGARAGLALCAAVIIPSLFPFMVLTALLLALNFPYGLGKITAPVMRRLFNVSGQGSTVFFLGLAGGYPLGAVTVSELYSNGQIEKNEAERLLGFCNNSGPAFIIAVAGSAVFSSASVGFYLYGVHVAAAVLTGIAMRGRDAPRPKALPPPATLGFSEAFSSAVRRSGASVVTVCGFVVFFSVLLSVLEAGGILPAVCGRLSENLGTELHFSRSLIGGILEIGSGIGSMTGLSMNAANLALAAFILGWGGLSVQAQSAAVIKESGLSASKHLLGKLIHGLLSALIAFFAYLIFF